MIFQNELIQKLQNGGEAVAIENGEVRVKYTDLLEKSNAIAAYLMANGVTKETPVGIQVIDRVEMIYCMIGVSIAGGIFIPLDTTLPTNRLNTVKDELDLKHLITAKDTLSAFSVDNMHTVAEMIDFDTDKEIESPEFSEDDSLYIYFTSGTTGIPKGIIGKNCSLTQFINWEIGEFNVDNTARFSQFISPYFDAFLRDVFVPLFAGGTICIPPTDEDFFSPEKMINWIDENEISQIHCVPSVFRVFNNEILDSGKFLNLKNVLLSGEKIAPSELENWYNKMDECVQLVNLYGTTEATMVRTFYRIQKGDAKKNRISIGEPIADTEILIASMNLKPCAPLMTGDLYIVSPYLSKGYLNNDELNAEKFILLDEGTEKERQAFKTGDKARRLPTGQIDLLGREDRQLKLRGIRIELGEIENVLMQSEAIEQAVVMSHNASADNAEGLENLISFVKRAESFDVNSNVVEILEKFSKDNLPNYMVPSIIVEVKEYPMLSNGKTDFKTLIESLEVISEIVKPANELEEQVLAIWQEILPGKDISTTDSFLKIGGNSLSIMRLIGKIYKDFKIRITLNELFNTLTIVQQAAFVHNARKDETLELTKVAESDHYVLSSAQDRIYYNYELDKNDTAFNLPMAWTIEAEVPSEKVESAFQQLVQRHEGLRTKFSYQSKGIMQSVLDEVTFELEQIEALNDSSEELDKAIEAFIRPFDLGKAPLIRAGIISVDGQQKVLVMDTHHIVCDGISQVNLLTDFIQFFNGNTPASIEFQYKDYAAWEKEFKTTENYLTHREFWLTSFEGKVPQLELPTSVDSEVANTNLGGNISFTIDTDVYKPIATVLKEDNVTEFSALFSVFFLFLSELTGQDDLVVGINSSGRIHNEMEPVVGMFVKTLPIRVKVNLQKSFKEFVSQVHKTLVKANSSQVYDLTDIVKHSNKADESKELIEAMFVFQNFEGSKGTIHGGAFSEYPFENKTSKYPISLFVNESESGLQVRFEYSQAYFTAADVEQVIERYKALMAAVSNNLEGKVTDFITDESTIIDVEDESISFNF